MTGFQGMADGQVKILISAAVDSSLAASTAQAADLIDQLNDKTLQSGVATSNANAAQSGKSLANIVAAHAEAMNTIAVGNRAQTAAAQQEHQKQLSSWKAGCGESMSAE